jgi:hypothetical protein
MGLKNSALTAPTTTSATIAGATTERIGSYSFRI